MAASTATASELTREQVQAVLVAPLAARSVFLASGPRIFDTTGPLRIPKSGAATNPSWHGENEQIAEVEADFDEVGLLPSTMESIKVITRYSNELARQSVVALDAALRDRLVTDVANTLDAQLLSASGDGIVKPKGLFAYSGIQTLAVGGALTLDTLLTAWGMALSANVNMAALRWVLTPGDFVGLRAQKDGDGRYLMQPDPTQDGVFRVFGAPVTVTARVPDTTGVTPTGRAALVDFSQIAVARDLAPSVKVLTERYADYDQQALRVVARYDAAPVNAEAVVAMTGITRA